MSCAATLKHLPAMVLGDLEGADRDAAVAHLRDCAS
ncbi:MAG: zf-HC2 domain-containing protein, partial [Candidatus Brocadiae bacterium]|nr:zf-HC2 domain-containing protein [Candidatus Brocadiia bacterium]